MRLWQKKRRVWINLTSLIDILFLLVVFLVVSGEFTHRQQLQIQLPSSTTKQQIEKKFLNIQMDKNQNLRVDNQNYDWQGLSTVLATSKYDREQTVQLEVDEAAPYKALIRLMDSLRNHGFFKIAFVTKLVN